MSVMFLDGQYVEVNNKTLDAFVPGRLQAKGVFETMRTQGAYVEFAGAHIKRLLTGLRVLGLKAPMTSSAFYQVIDKVISRNPKITSGRMRFLVFADGKALHSACMLVPYQPPSKGAYQKGLTLSIIKTKRKATARQADVKSLDYGLFSQALAEAKTKGTDEAILLNERGQVFEASRANVFVLRKGVWTTPALKSGCLNGIMRQQLIRQARKIKINIVEASLYPDDLVVADEILLTNSLIGVIRARLLRA